MKTMAIIMTTIAIIANLATLRFADRRALAGLFCFERNTFPQFVFAAAESSSPAK
jgi:hypothetical protein